MKKEIKLTLKHEKRYEEAKANEQEKANMLNECLDENGQINKLTAKP